MMAVKLEQYLASVVAAAATETNEIFLKPGRADFSLLKVFLENHTSERHRYQTANVTILYAAAGDNEVKLNGQAVQLQAGNIVLLQSKCDYEVRPQKPKDLLVKLEFSHQLNYQLFLGAKATLTANEQELVKQIKTSLMEQRLLYLGSKQLAKPSELMLAILDEYLKQDLFACSLILAELNALFVFAIRNQNLVLKPLAKQDFAQSALEQYIDANFANITLKQAAQYFNLNANYFSTLVKQKTGKSFVEQVDERRMEEARRLLARPDISIKEIIRQVGYNGKSFFYKKFNEYYHETPVQMRAELFRQANINLN